MKRRLIIGLCSVSVFAALAALYVKDVGAVSCVSPYSHRTYLLAGVEKHSCVRTTTGSTIFDWGVWGVSKRSIRNGLGLQVQLFGTVDAEGGICPQDPANLDPSCLIKGVAFCCNGGGGCGGAGQPFTSPPLSAFTVVGAGDCDSTGKCRDTVTLDLPDELICQNRNWGGTFTPEEMYLKSCTCDTGFVNGVCTAPAGPSCIVEFCQVDLTDYQPGVHKDYNCTLVFGDEH